MRRAAAKLWRADAQVALHEGRLRAPSPITLQEAATKWLAGAREGLIRTRSGDEYKPSAVSIGRRRGGRAGHRRDAVDVAVDRWAGHGVGKT